MGITLEFNVKDGKNTLKALVEASDVDGVMDVYQQLQQRFGGAVAITPSTPRSKKTEEAKAAEPMPTGTPTHASEPKPERSFTTSVLASNLRAKQMADRMALCIPQFRGKSATEIVQQLNFNKPMATMKTEELGEVIKVIHNTLSQYGNNNPEVAAYLKVINRINGLKTGTQEDWARACQDVTAEEWALLQAPENALLMEDVNKYLAEISSQMQHRQALLAKDANAAAVAAAAEALV